MRKKSEADLGTLIRSLGGDWKKFEDKRACPHCHKLLYRVDNRGYDGMATIRGISIPIEVKSGQRSFAFADLKPHQHEALLEWENKHGKQSWIALQVGTGRVNQKKEGLPRKFWLFPHVLFQRMEALLDETVGQKSIPYSLATTRNKLIHKYNLTLVEGYWDYEIIWMDGKWILPTWHVFRLYYLRDTYINKEYLDDQQREDELAAVRYGRR